MAKDFAEACAPRGNPNRSPTCHCCWLKLLYKQLPTDAPQSCTMISSKYMLWTHRSSRGCSGRCVCCALPLACITAVPLVLSLKPSRMVAETVHKILKISTAEYDVKALSSLQTHLSPLLCLRPQQRPWRWLSLWQLQQQRPELLPGRTLEPAQIDMSCNGVAMTGLLVTSLIGSRRGGENGGRTLGRPGHTH